MVALRRRWWRGACWLGLTLPTLGHAQAPRTWGSGEPELEVAPPAAAPLEPDAIAVLVPTERAARLRYHVDDVQVVGNRSTRTPVVLGFVPVRTGDALDVNDTALVDARFRLLSTGFFRDVRFSLRRGRERGHAVLVVHVVERNTVVVNDVWLGVSADADADGNARPLTAFGGLDVSENNLLGTGVSVGGAVAVADRQLALRARILHPDVRRSGWTAFGQLLYNGARDFMGQRDVLVEDPSSTRAVDHALVTYKRFGGSVGVGHELWHPADRVFFEYRLEGVDARLPLAASHRRGLDVEPIAFHLQSGASVLSTVRASYVHDTRDVPVLASRGSELGVLAEASLGPLGSEYAFAKLQARATRYVPLPWQHVLRLEAFVGAIFGDAPLFDRYYVGDFSDLLPDRILDLNVDRRPAPAFFGTAIREVRYGTQAARLLGEYRVPLYRGQRSIRGVDLFGSAGLYAVADAADLRLPARGYTGLRRIPFDLTFNLGLRADTAIGAMTFGASTLVGFLPLRGGTP